MSDAQTKKHKARYASGPMRGFYVRVPVEVDDRLQELADVQGIKKTTLCRIRLIESLGMNPELRPYDDAPRRNLDLR